MKLGVCTGFENIQAAADAGFDYLECALSALAAMPEAQFRALAERRADFPIPVSRCNGFLPGTLKVVGPEANPRALDEYLERAFSRAHALGVELAVFGSGGARGVPEGFSHAEAWRQIADFLRRASDCGRKYQISVAIEPLRREECNILNYVSEAVLLSALLDLPEIGALGDTFHMRSGAEPWSALTQAGEKLRHVHVSHELDDLSGRVFPSEGDGTDYEGIFAALRAGGYSGGVSMEAGTTDFAADAARAVKCLRPFADAARNNSSEIR